MLGDTIGIGCMDIHGNQNLVNSAAARAVSIAASVSISLGIRAAGTCARAAATLYARLRDWHKHGLDTLRHPVRRTVIMHGMPIVRRASSVFLVDFFRPGAS